MIPIEGPENNAFAHHDSVMGMEADDVHFDKELDGVIIYSNGINDQDVEPLPKVINLDPPSVDILDENAELQDCEVKKCNSDEAYEVKQLCEVEKCEQNLPGFNSEVNMSKEEDATSEHQKVTDGNKKRQACGKKATKPAIGNCKIKCTVPQPFALATEKRALYGIRPSGAESDNITSGGKPSHVRVSSHSSSLKQNPVNLSKPIFRFHVYLELLLKYCDFGFRYYFEASILSESTLLLRKTFFPVFI